MLQHVRSISIFVDPTILFWFAWDNPVDEEIPVFLRDSPASGVASVGCNAQSSQVEL